MERTQVVVIGGGATGAGILWDLTLRGMDAILLEQGDVANGATGRCHGLLHSGARYVVKDQHAAAECLAENRILKHIAPHAIEDGGGMFVECTGDDPSFSAAWQKAAEAIALPHTHLNAGEARTLEPELASAIRGAFTTPDAHVDVFRLVLANLEAAVNRGARYHTYAKVVALLRSGDRVAGVRCLDTRTGEVYEIGCEMVINAGGGWAQSVAAMAGIDVPVRCDKGTLLVLHHRLSQRVLHRCRMPGDADILVPAGPVCILGTSSMTVPGPDGLSISQDEINALIATGSEMVPALREARILRAFCGVRPLYQSRATASRGGREISRGYHLIDHAREDGVHGFVSIIGGKLTTYRLMAQAVTDHVARTLGNSAACTTDTTPLRATATDTARHALDAPLVAKMRTRLGTQAEQLLQRIDQRPELGEVVCECELVTRAELEHTLSTENPLHAETIADIGRRTRLGFGPCQGTYCGYKAMLTGYHMHRWTADQAAHEFEQYMAERWKGQSAVERGKQAEQCGISHALYPALRSEEESADAQV